ncbi:helix-turn-helix domain-containing protein [Herbiconiux sp. P15]|uniref:AraC family transcriptional regulator n=1 Tax=Herbiconiux liukaitaii TaxID=3342799 RepID=UPI0035B6D363
MNEATPGEPASDVRDGFANQRLCVVPRPQVDAAAVRAGTRRLLVTDAGYFPRAHHHRRRRSHGAAETIVILCVAGRGTVTVDGQSYELTPSSSAIIPPFTSHEYAASDDDPWTIWWMHVRGADVADLIGPVLAGQQPVIELKSVDRIAALFDELVGSLEQRTTPIHLLAAAGVAWHLLTRLAADSMLPATGSPLERAMRYLEARVEGAITVTELAAIVGLSPSHLSTLFRHATGGGPGAFHTSLKMGRARTLLDTTTMPVAEVALAVGYADPLYFSRHFRRLHGVNPSTYRSQHKG